MSDAQQALQRLEAPPPEATSSAVLAIISRAAADNAVDVDKMERLLAMHERILARDAEMAFNLAMREAQSKMPQLKKDARNPQTNSLYTRLETLNRAAVPIYTAHGFSLSFGTAESPLPEHRRITCRVSHCAGHSQNCFLDLPLDMVGLKGSPNKTAIHGYGSTISYGRRYLTMMIFNISTGEDVDGNAESGSEEVLVGVKAILWKLLLKHSKVHAGQTWKDARQFFVDEMMLDPDQAVPENDAAGMRKLLAAANKKLEGK
jgi:hypothetical protein